MSATTVNSFPSFHSMDSPRGWAMAIIVLLHVGFFWALTSGMTPKLMKIFIPQAPIQLPEYRERVVPPPEPIKDVRIDLKPFVPTHVAPKTIFDDNDTAPLVANTEPQPVGTFNPGGDVIAPPDPVIVEPRIDSRRGLSEPDYPAAEVRAGNEGTVLLSVYVLADGRVGDVKLDRSSGFRRLDDSAMREAKKWRFVPGTRDGAATAMWRQIPITFRLDQ